ncbi:MAG: hypothetical protein L0332_26045, partial [Chloroflexi bacterium]|nr:hypothetical protein [Chloroflexota bacterium]MCI0730161.1 hypothetical protein [Chloroflexota bacterium]
MNQSRSRAVRYVLSWLFLVALIQLSAGPSAVYADPPPWPPAGEWTPVEVGPPQMAYQPPPDANELSDFTPPGAVVTNAPVNVPNLPPATATPPGAPPTATVTPPPTTTVTPPAVTPTANLSATVSVNSALTNVVTFGNSAVAVVIEADTLPPGAELQFAAVPVPAITTTNTLSNPLDTRTLVRFQLEAIETPGGNVVESFARPVRLVVDLRQLTAGLNPVYTNYWLAYQDESDPLVWHGVDIDVYQPNGLISAEVTHFSNWAAGVRPERWNP